MAGVVTGFSSSLPGCEVYVYDNVMDFAREDLAPPRVEQIVTTGE